MTLRLDKYLAELGAGTRSEVKKLIRAKLVTVNGTVAAEPELKVEELRDEVCLRGERLVYAAHEYYLFHKPAGCVSATEDAVHRTVLDYLPDAARRGLFPVGRLDIDTEGLLLLTDDGVLAHELLAPAKHVPKTYYAKVRGEVMEEDVRQFAEGIDIGEKKLSKPACLKVLSTSENERGEPISEIELTITEGKFHQVKRMFTAVGREVIYLRRIAMGSLALPDDLKPGEYRPLTTEELAGLRNLARIHKEVVRDMSQ